MHKQISNLCHQVSDHSICLHEILFPVHLHQHFSHCYLLFLHSSDLSQSCYCDPLTVDFFLSEAKQNNKC